MMPLTIFGFALFATTTISTAFADDWNPGWGKTPTNRCESWFHNGSWGVNRNCDNGCAPGAWGRRHCAATCLKYCPYQINLTPNNVNESSSSSSTSSSASASEESQKMHLKLEDMNWVHNKSKTLKKVD